MPQLCDSFPFDHACLVCGHKTCSEAYDHIKITHHELDRLLTDNRSEDHQRTQLINQVQEFYNCLAEEVLKVIQEDRQKVLQTLKKSDYQFLKSNPKVSLDLVGELACGNYSSLPSKRLIPIVQSFENLKVKTFVKDRQNQIQSTIRECISVQNFLKKRNDFKDSLLAPILQLREEVKFVKNRKVSVRENENPEKIIPCDDSTQVSIKGRVITQKSVEAQINNRNVNDNDIVSSINELKKLKLLSKVEIRNNKITNLTCKMIAFNLPHLAKLDIRGNNVGDEGILVLAKNLRGLQEFYICQNKVTDVAVEQIYQSMKELRMLWMEDNQISLSAALKIITLENLRAVALHGNLFSQDEGQCLKVQFFGFVNL